MIHPKYINRRHRERRYVFIHRSSDFKGRIVGVRFTDGQSEPMEMRRALRIAGAMGAKIRYGYCLDIPQAFGDMSPEERAAALEAGGDTPAVEKRFTSLVARLRAIKPDEVDDDRFEQDAADQLDALMEMSAEDAEHVLDALAEHVAVMEDEAAARAGDEPGPDVGGGSDRDDDSPDDADAAPDGPQDAEDGDGGDGSSEGDAAPQGADAGREQPETEPAPPEDDEPVEPEGEFAGEDEVAGMAAEPIAVSQAELHAMTKAQLDAWAQENLGLSLDTRQTKADMVDEVIAHDRIEEVQG